MVAFVKTRVAAVALASMVLVPAALAGAFNPDGYYFPKRIVVLRGYKLTFIALSTLDYSAAEPKPAASPKAFLTLERLSHEQRYDCKLSSAKPERLEFICFDTPVGTISIIGRFADPRGDFARRDDIKTMKTVVLIADIVVSREGRLAIKQVPFTYWEGD